MKKSIAIKEFNNLYIVLLLLFCISTALIFHNDLSNQMQLIAFLKNIGLSGGLLFLIINGTKDWSLEKKKNTLDYNFFLIKLL